MPHPLLDHNSYLLSEVLRWAPGSSLTPSVRDQLTAFKRNLEELFETQTRGHPGAAAGFGVPLDGPPPATQPPMAFSSELQATLAVFTSLALHQSQKRHGRGATVCMPRHGCARSNARPFVDMVCGFHRIICSAQYNPVCLHADFT